MPASASTGCPQCGEILTDIVEDGLCAACLLAAVLERGEMPELGTSAQGREAPRQCGDYQILEELGRGGMGVVFRARQRGLSREVALKMIAAAEFAGPEQVRRFRVEAEAASKLEHPNIVPVHSLGMHDGLPFLVMKLAEGGNLAQRLAEQGPPPAQEAARIAAMVARAVQFAHERGVLHRDLKPANILLDASDQPLVGDFGLARLSQSTGASTGGAMGTPAYMAPELAANDGAATTAADVWGLGAMLYHLLAGQPPFSGKSALEVMRQAECHEPPPLEKVDRDLATVCLKCLEKRPDRRYATAGALAEDLERWLRGEPVAARPAGSFQRLWKWAKRRPVMAAVSALGLCAAVGFVTLLMIGHVLLSRQKDLAQAKEAEASAAAARAADSEAAMRQNLYSSDMFLARRAMDEGNLGVVRQALDRHVPVAGEEDLRGIEWRLLREESRSSASLSLTGHSRAVTAVAFHPQGAMAASAGRDGKICIWSIPDGQRLTTLPSSDAPIGPAELASFLTHARAAPEVADELNRNPLRFDYLRMRWRPSALGELTALCWSPDGRHLAAGSFGAFVRIWRTDTWQMEGFFPLEAATELAFSADGSRLVIAHTLSDTKGEVVIYDVATRQRRRTIRDVQPCFALAGDGARIFTADRNGVVRLQPMEEEKIETSWNCGNSVSRLLLLPEGKRLATIENGGAEVSVWLWSEQKKLARLTFPGGRAQTLAVSPDGNTLVMGGTLNTIKSVHTHAWKMGWQLRGHEDEVRAAAFSPDGRLLLTGSNDRQARLWTLEAKPAEVALPEEPLKSLTASPDGGYVLTMRPDEGIQCWNLGANRKVEIPQPAEGQKRQAGCFFADGRGFWTVLQDGIRTFAEQWSVEGGPLSSPKEVQAPVRWERVVFDENNGQAAFVKANQPLRVCRLRDGSVVFNGDRKTSGLSRIVFAPDGRRIICIAWPRTLQVIDLGGHDAALSWEASAGTVEAAAFSPDGQIVATAGDDNFISIWESRTGSKLAELRGHQDCIRLLRFTPDGKTLVSAADDRVLRLWHVATWRELGVHFRGQICDSLLCLPQGLVFRENAKRLRMLRASSD